MRLSPTMSIFGTQNEQTISRLDDGGFLISWADHDGSGGDRGGSSTDIYARRYDANGEPQQFSLSVEDGCWRPNDPGVQR